MSTDVTALFSVVTESKLFQLALELGAALGLPVTSWRVDDPTRANFQFTAEQLAARDQMASDLAKSAFLSTAEGDWKTLVASEVYGVDRDLAGYAAPTVTLRNNGGGNYPRAVGDLTVKASGINKTYHSTSSGLLSPGATVTFSLIADEPGAESSVGANEIDEIVTKMLGVEIVSSTAATALNAQDDESLEDQCNDTLGALSPNGPDDAYEYVVKNSALTGSTEITRAKTQGASDYGYVTVYVAGPSGTVSGAAITAAQDAVEKWATPQCIRPTVVNATTVPIDITATIYGDGIPSDFLTKISIALTSLFSKPEMQGGTVARSKIDETIHSAVPQITRVVIALPTVDSTLLISEIPVLGALLITEAP